MGFLTDWLTDWLKELLIEGIMGNLTGLFDTVNSRVGEIAVQVGTTPAAWNAGVFSLIRQLSETVILPIAGLILTFVATYELIQLIIEKNNLHDLDYWIFFKWIFKTACAILILSNTFNIVMAVFDVSQSVIARAAGIVQGSTDISEAMLADLEATLEALDKIGGVDYLPNHAAFYLFPRLDKSRFDFEDAHDFAMKFLHEQHVLVIPGDGFDWHEDLRFRIVMLPEPETLTKAMGDMAYFLKQHRI